MQHTLFGDRALINKQHELSKQSRLEEEAEQQQKKLKKMYTINVEYSETVTEYHTDKINICAIDEEDAENKAHEWAYDQGDDIEVNEINILSEEYDPEETDTKTIDMFTHEYPETNTDE